MIVRDKPEIAARVAMLRDLSHLIKLAYEPEQIDAAD
jgi:hypothetical protein